MHFTQVQNIRIIIPLIILKLYYVYKKREISLERSAYEKGPLDEGSPQDRSYFNICHGIRPR